MQSSDFDSQPNGFGSYNFDIMLTYVERLGSLLALIGYVLLVLSAGQAEMTLREQQGGAQTSFINNISPKTAVDSTVVRLVGFTILTIIATIRLIERKQRIESGQETESLTPNIIITFGSWVSTIGFAILTVGVIQRQQELAPVTIL